MDTLTLLICCSIIIVGIGNLLPKNLSETRTEKIKRLRQKYMKKRYFSK